MKCVVIGLGVFGSSLVDELFECGHEIIAVDRKESNLERVKDKCSACFGLDATDSAALSTLPLSKIDSVMVCIGESMSDSLRVVALLQKLRIKNIYARAIDPVHEMLLKAFNIKAVLCPEEDSSKSFARSLSMGGDVETYRINYDYSIFSFDIPDSYVDCPLSEFTELDQFGMKIVAMNRPKLESRPGSGIVYSDYELVETLSASTKVEKGDKIFVLGKEKDFRELLKRIGNK